MWIDDCMGIGRRESKLCDRAETEADDCRCECYSIACGIVQTCWRSDVKQDAHDKLGEPARWVLYEADFDKSPYPVMDKHRSEQWMNMYSILDCSTLEKAVFKLIKESLSDFHLASYLIDEVQIGSVDISCGKTFFLHFPSTPVLSVSSTSRVAFSRHIRQNVTMLPRIIRVCRLLTRRELR